MERRPESHPYTRPLSILGVLSLVAGLLVMLLLPQIKLAAWGIMGIGVVVLIVALVLDFRRVSSALIGRRGRLGAGTTLMASIFFGITLLVNGISVTAFQRFDTTRLAQFTLTQETKDVLAKLDKPVKAICFFVPSKDQYGITAYAESLLVEYQTYTKNLKIEIVDPDEHPDRARQYQILEYQSVVFESGDKHRVVPPSQIIQFDDQGVPQQIEAEHAFTSALLEVTGVAQKKVYFLTGHDEASLNGNYSSVLRGLRDDLYIVDTVNLITNPTVPADAAVLIIAAPQTALTATEVDAINTYLQAGGQAFILTDPNYPDGLNEILSPYGVQLGSGTVIDQASSVAPRKDMPLVTGTRNFFGQTMGISMTTYFPGAVGVIPLGTETEYPPLVYTTTDSWLQKDFDPTKDPVFNKDADVKGPIAIGVVIAAAQSDQQKKLTRVIVIGDSDFASNEHFSQVNNGDLFLDSVNWLAEETQLITIHRAALPFRRLAVDPEQANFIRYSSLAIPPVLVLLIGAIVWWYRR